MGGATAAAELRGFDTVPPPPITLGNLAVFPDQFRATLAGQPVALTYRQFQLLVLLARRADRVVHYGEVEEALWGRRGSDLRQRMSVLVCRLREQLAGMEPYRIETVRRVGYRLAASSPGPGGTAARPGEAVDRT